MNLAVLTLRESLKSLKSSLVLAVSTLLESLKFLKLYMISETLTTPRALRQLNFCKIIKTSTTPGALRQLNLYTIFNTKCIFIYRALRDVTLLSINAIYCIPSIKIAQHWKPTSLKNFDNFSLYKIILYTFIICTNLDEKFVTVLVFVD